VRAAPVREVRPVIVGALHAVVVAELSKVGALEGGAQLTQLCFGKLVNLSSDDLDPASSDVHDAAIVVYGQTINGALAVAARSFQGRDWSGPRDCVGRMGLVDRYHIRRRLLLLAPRDTEQRQAGNALPQPAPGVS